MSADRDDATTLERASSGDGDAFRELVEPYRRELQMHCYRILGSVQDAEDVLQETLLAAWQALQRFDGRALRAWLYRIATNRSLNHLRANKRHGRTPSPARPQPPMPSPSDEPWWLEPYPDHLLGAAEPGPEARYDARESIALSFISALQELTPRERAVLILRDTLGFSAAETAEMLDTTPAGVNSSLQRARREFSFQRDPALVPLPRSLEEGAIVDRFADAFEAGDVGDIIDLLTEDARFTMPPDSIEYRGREAIAAFIQQLGFWNRPIKFIPTRANGQPALAYYPSDPSCSLFRAGGLLVLSLRQQQISQIARFGDKAIIARFGLPRTIQSDNSDPQP